jgi:predicted phage terminase large subunit-like protein
MSFISLLQFWKIKRRQMGEPCEIRPFHQKIANHLTDLMLGRLPTSNLMVLMPPRCAKTDLGVRTFVPWAQSYFPDSEFIVSSYASDLANESTIDIRRTLSSDWYRGMVGSDWGANVKMVGDKASGHVDHFRTEEGGAIKAIGVGGGITGFGAGKLRSEFGGAIVIDDPLKAQDAKSAAMRKSVVDFYIGGLKTRRNRKENPKTPIVLIMQRLHPDDLAGYCLANERDEWTVLQLPAHDDACTETIWPGRLGMQELLEMRESRPDEYWAQYMQEPSESALTIFKRGWWKYWSDKAQVERRITLKIITADTAFKAKDSADYSVLQCWGFESLTGSYLLDQVRGRWEFPELLRATKSFLAKHMAHVPGITPVTECWVEDKASGQSLVQTMRREGLPVREWEPNDKTAPDKVARANQCTMPISAGRVYLPNPKLEGYKWVDGFVNEHFAFTTDDSHLYDDQVDAQTMAHLIWMQRGGGRGPIPVWVEAA